MECADVHVNTGIAGLVDRHKDRNARHTGQSTDRAKQADQETVEAEQEGAAILTLSLVCSKCRTLVGDDIFRHQVHFRWILTVHVWERVSLNLENIIMLRMTYMSA